MEAQNTSYDETVNTFRTLYNEKSMVRRGRLAGRNQDSGEILPFSWEFCNAWLWKLYCQSQLRFMADWKFADSCSENWQFIREEVLIAKCYNFFEATRILIFLTSFYWFVNPKVLKFISSIFLKNKLSELQFCFFCSSFHICSRVLKFFWLSILPFMFTCSSSVERIKLYFTLFLRIYIFFKTMKLFSVRS